jgi:hypothetical protein
MFNPLTKPKGLGVNEQWRLFLEHTPEQRLRDSTSSLYMNDAVILALIISTIQTDAVDPITEGIFGMPQRFQQILRQCRLAWHYTSPWWALLTLCTWQELRTMFCV